MKTKSWKLKTFDELENLELYRILRLRNSVFVVDQKCPFEEIDNKDLNKCYHLFCQSDDKVISYARIFEPGIVYKEPCLSRVCTDLSERGKGLGKELLITAITKMEELYSGKSIRIGAQLYLKKFYETYCFEVVGDPYLEDGIDHVQMIRVSKFHAHSL